MIQNGGQGGAPQQQHPGPNQGHGGGQPGQGQPGGYYGVGQQGPGGGGAKPQYH